MPHIAIPMIPGRNDEVKKALALKIQDIPMEEWADSMEQFSDELCL